MDGSALLNIVLVLFFILLGGVFAAAEMALVTLREGQILRLDHKGQACAVFGKFACRQGDFSGAAAQKQTAQAQNKHLQKAFFCVQDGFLRKL